MFNAFFEVNKEVKTLGKLGVDRSTTMQLLATGTRTLERYEEADVTSAPSESLCAIRVNSGVLS